MPLPLLQIDAFTDRAFGGNPAAVCLLQEPMSDLWMQHVAQEMNLAETAFLLPEPDGYSLRWFTPVLEVDLCGHATLASAHALWEGRHLAPEATARFHTRSGLLTARQNGEWIELDFPAEPATEVAAPPELLDGLPITPRYVGKNRFDYLVEVESEAALRALRPDFSLLACLSARGVIVTAPASTPNFDFVSRFFAPACGINEDPVTGSAHCCLGPYWYERLHRQTFTAFQASARGGIVKVNVMGNRVLLDGQAVTVLRGELTDRAI